MKCQKCPLGARRNLRTNFAPGEGDAHPDILFVGKAPGEEEDKSSSFRRESIAIAAQMVGVELNQRYTRVIRCRLRDKIPPQPDEIEACREHLVAEVLETKPKLICTFGRIASNCVIRDDRPPTRSGVGVNLSEDQGKVFWTFWGHPEGVLEIPTMISFHPAFIRLNRRCKGLYFENLQAIIRKVKHFKEL